MSDDDWGFLSGSFLATSIIFAAIVYGDRNTACALCLGIGIADILVFVWFLIAEMEKPK